MRRSLVAWAFFGTSLSSLGCGPRAATPNSTAPRSGAGAPQAPVTFAAASNGGKPAPLLDSPRAVSPAPPACSPADWSPRALTPLLKPGTSKSELFADQEGVSQWAFEAECSDAPTAQDRQSPNRFVVDGVEVRLTSVTPAGSSGRGWAGNQCSFEVRLADGAGIPARLGAAEVPPFTTISALVRRGSAAWLGISFNGYSAEFPKGGNRVVAVDLCAGRVMWQSKDASSNGGLLLLEDYLIAPYGFTRERRYVFVFDARSGNVIQRLPVIENVCPSKRWAPNWKPGERCDAPGQSVGAATAPRVEGGLFFVDTNTGSASFQFMQR